MMTGILVVTVVAVVVKVPVCCHPVLASRSVFITRTSNYDDVLKSDPCHSWCSCCVPAVCIDLPRHGLTPENDKVIVHTGLMYPN